ncbi:hypothetical protein JTB14_016065 [Gonioctena quinquepunctata]|nr:hypothetical protein JTB14_016065 [Gonioctena quinquepunctata]
MIVIDGVFWFNLKCTNSLQLNSQFILLCAVVVVPFVGTAFVQLPNTGIDYRKHIVNFPEIIIYQRCRALYPLLT